MAEVLPPFLPQPRPYRRSKSIVAVPSPVSMSSSFTRIIRAFEDSPGAAFSVLDVAHAHQVPHRRAYDFFNFLSSFGVCAAASRGSLRWVGLHAIPPSLADAYAQVEVAACSHRLRALFCAGPSPTLGRLATQFACLFFFLGTAVLSIRAAVRLLHDGKSGPRSLERRIYLAVSFLEAAVIVEHTARSGEYRMVIDRAGIVDAAMAARRRHLHDAGGASFESLLSRYDERFMARLYEERQADLARFLSK
jgi:hypothetical protein